MAGSNKGKEIVVFDEVPERNKSIREKVVNIPGSDMNQINLLSQDSSNPDEYIFAYFEYIYNTEIRSKNISIDKPIDLEIYRDLPEVAAAIVAHGWLPLFDKSIVQYSSKYVRLFYANMWTEDVEGKTQIHTVIKGRELIITQALVNTLLNVPHTPDSIFMHKHWYDSKMSKTQVFIDLTGTENDLTFNDLDQTDKALAIISTTFIQCKK